MTTQDQNGVEYLERSLIIGDVTPERRVLQARCIARLEFEKEQHLLYGLKRPMLSQEESESQFELWLERRRQERLHFRHS